MIILGNSLVKKCFVVTLFIIINTQWGKACDIIHARLIQSCSKAHQSNAYKTVDSPWSVKGEVTHVVLFQGGVGGCSKHDRFLVTTVGNARSVLPGPVC